MSMVRNSFSDRREGYTDKAVVIRFVIEKLSCHSNILFLACASREKCCMGFKKSSFIQLLWWMVFYGFYKQLICITTRNTVMSLKKLTIFMH